MELRAFLDGEGEIEFRAVGSAATYEAMQSVTMDKMTVKRLMEEYLAGVIKERLEILGADKEVLSQFHTRASRAVRDADVRISAMVNDLLAKAVRDAVTEHIENMDIRVLATVSERTKEG